MIITIKDKENHRFRLEFKKMNDNFNIVTTTTIINDRKWHIDNIDQQLTTTVI